MNNCCQRSGKGNYRGLWVVLVAVMSSYLLLWGKPMPDTVGFLLMVLAGLYVLCGYVMARVDVDREKRCKTKCDG